MHQLPQNKGCLITASAASMEVCACAPFLSFFSLADVQGHRQVHAPPVCTSQPVSAINARAPEEPAEEALLGVVAHKTQRLIRRHVVHHGIKHRGAGAQEYKAAPAQPAY
jgi:hypothetical protein